MFNAQIIGAFFVGLGKVMISQEVDAEEAFTDYPSEIVEHMQAEGVDEDEAHEFVDSYELPSGIA